MTDNNGRSADEPYNSQVFDCPECGAHLQFGLAINVRRVKVAATPPVGWSRPLDNLSVPERTVVEECRVAGILQAYMSAFNASAWPEKPSDPEKFFIRFLTHAHKKKTPQFAIRLCLPEDARSGNLELWTHGIISCVLADGEFRQFLPTELVTGDKTSTLSLEQGQIKAGEKLDLDRWVKTKFGYVVAHGVFYQALKQRCIGDFARTMG